MWYGNVPQCVERPARIAVIPGDGVGPEVIQEGQRVLEWVMELDSQVKLVFEEFPWGSAYYRTYGRVAPEDFLNTLTAYDAIYFGAVGTPDVPLAIPVRGLLLPIRQGLQAYVNLRPVLRLPMNILIVRENTEGEYVDAGGRLFADTDGELAIQTSVFSRAGVSRVIHYAFRLARHMGRSCTSVSKGNALQYSAGLWDAVFAEIATQYPDVPHDSVLVDAAAYYMVTQPERFGVIVTSNLFGDILSDLGAGLMGNLGLAASANFRPDHLSPGFFEPVHGSAPDIAGQGLANPIGAVGAAGMMLGYLGYPAWERRIRHAIACAINAVSTEDGNTKVWPTATISQHIRHALESEPG